MNIALVILWALAAGGFVVMQKYNGIIQLRNVREQAFANIDVQLKQRFDLIPNLLETVKWYAKHEKETLENITKARTRFLDASANGSTSGKVQADNMLTGALKSLFAVSENYPELKANTNFLQFQTELSDIENKIAASRRWFNAATQEYNTYIQMFPTNIIAGMFGFKKSEMFEADNNEKETVTVKF